MRMARGFVDIGDIVHQAKQYTDEQYRALLVNGMAEQNKINYLLREQEQARRELQQKHDDQMQTLTLKYRERDARIVAGQN